MMTLFSSRSLATLLVAVLPALACSRSVNTAPVRIASTSTNVRTVGSVGAPLGLQLWSLREMAKTDVPGMLALTRQMGITHVETAGLYGLTPAQFAAALDKAGLRATSMHWGYDDFKKRPDSVIAAAKTLGAKYVGLAWYPHSGAFTEADARKAIADFNEFGRAMKAGGLQFFYHNHGYEPVKYGDGTLLDLVISGTDPDLVKFEEDVLWTYLPGVDPAALLRKYPGRFKLMHIKDMKPGVARGSLTGGLPDAQQAAIGQGQVNWPDVMAAAKATGVEYYYIEDETTDPKGNIPPSVTYLEGVKF